MNKLNIYCFTEGKKVPWSSYPFLLSLKQEIANFITGDNFEFSWCITGFLSIRTFNVVIFPKKFKYIEKSEDLKTEIKTLLNTLLKYQQRVQSSNNYQNIFLGNGELVGDELSTAGYLIQDFYQFGLYNNQTKIQKRNLVGQINWGATTSKCTPIIANKTPLYHTVITDNRTIDQTNFIRKIHSYVLQKISDQWGWLFDFNYGASNNTCSVNDETISFLYKELNSKFKDREINLIKQLIQYLEKHHRVSKTNRSLAYITSSFHCVWEDICSYLFQNEYDQLCYLVTSPEWHSPVIKGYVRQIPDILYIHRNQFYILDAKYYDYENAVPGSHDVIKQFVYKETIEKSIQQGNLHIPLEGEINNVFVFPGVSSSFISNLGYIDFPTIQSFGKISVCSLDIKWVMKLYLSNQYITLRSLLKKII